ncbi:MAG: hypothetical protein SH820_05400 [Xanthomonadales bacterium]|nr:hypothetical protein [Xanthomonadales bacterium]
MQIHPFAKPVALALSLLLLAAPLSWAQEMAPTPLDPAKQKPAPAKPTPLTSAEVTQQQKLAIDAYEAGEYLKFVQATMRLRNARPYEPQYMVGMVVGGALVGRQKTAYSYMHIMQQQGLSYDFNQTADTESIRGSEVYDYLNNLLIKAAEPSGMGKTLFDLPKANHYPEALVWDASADRFLVGTLEGGNVLAISLDGKVSKLLSANKKNGLRAIYGLAVDAERKRLWVSTSAIAAFGKLAEAEFGKTALLEFNLETLELLNRFEPPADQFPHLLGSLGLTPNGDVFVLDRALPQLFVKPAESDTLQLYMQNFELTGLRDLTLSDDGKRLYLADAALGIMVVDLELNAGGMLAGPETLNLGGISGIDYADGRLYVLQNGIAPQRLQRLDLDENRTAAVNILPLASSLEPFDFPSFARVRGEDVYYFAGSNLQGERADKFMPVIMSTPTEPLEGELTPEQRYIEEMNLKGVKE